MLIFFWLTLHLTGTQQNKRECFQRWLTKKKAWLRSENRKQKTDGERRMVRLHGITRGPTGPETRAAVRWSWVLLFPRINNSRRLNWVIATWIVDWHKQSDLWRSALNFGNSARSTEIRRPSHVKTYPHFYVSPVSRVNPCFLWLMRVPRYALTPEEL